jgi:hypothetical protein
MARILVAKVESHSDNRKGEVEILYIHCLPMGTTVIGGNWSNDIRMVEHQVCRAYAITGLD